MNEAEKQDSRKTIIAFGAGLLIGALLVWAFTSATPDNGENNDQGANVSDTSEDVDDDDTTEEDDDTDTTVDEDDNDNDTVSMEGEELSVPDQPAGSVVVLSDVAYPDGSGWVAVGDSVDGESVRFLGAARFDTSTGLEPTEVPLLRATEAGVTYRVALFMEDGDGDFSRAGGDSEIQGTATTFVAE